MSNQQKLLEGDVIDPQPQDEASEIARLRQLNRGLTAELNDALAENDQLRKQKGVSEAALSRLRKNLTPFYKLLQAVFGDIDDIAPAGDDAPDASSSNNRPHAAWEEWKQKLPGAPARIIAALQKHGEADTTQLCILIGTPRRQTVHDAVHKLNSSGLINKNGNRFSLKQL